MSTLKPRATRKSAVRRDTAMLMSSSLTPPANAPVCWVRCACSEGRLSLCQWPACNVTQRCPGWLLGTETGPPTRSAAGVGKDARLEGVETDCTERMTGVDVPRGVSGWATGVAGT